MSGKDLPSIEVCLSPALLHLYDTNDKIVVIIDVFRATSTIAAALHNGASAVVPVSSVQECIEIGKQTANSVTAGERDGKVAEGLEYGNSPSEYPASFIAGKKLILTTTNGTRLLHMVQGAADIITGSFLNLTAVCDFLVAQNKSVILGCAAWKDRYNLEDSLFAGAVASSIQDHFITNCDSTRASKYLYESSRGAPDFISFLRESSHYKRLAAYGLESDMEYCATPDLHPVVPILRGKELVIHQ
ncbi:MAG: 2-phosphosulfolactate phosphatase [Sphingobacteriales bacterium]|nr:MAG: 2-phosphosulfolactate phosphatase [Sphingobacteriales bacterium]